MYDASCKLLLQSYKYLCFFFLARAQEHNHAPRLCVILAFPRSIRFMGYKVIGKRRLDRDVKAVTVIFNAVSGASHLLSQAYCSGLETNRKVSRGVWIRVCQILEGQKAAALVVLVVGFRLANNPLRTPPHQEAYGYMS